MSDLSPDPDPAADSPYPISPAALRALALTLSRPPADAPEATWQEVVQDGLDALGGLDPRDAVQAMLAVQIVAANAGALDALRLAFEPGTTSAQAHRQRGSAASLARVAATAMRLLKQQRLLPAVPTRDWGGAAEALAAAWRAAPVRPAEPPRSGKPAAPEPEEIIRWLDEVPDDELDEEIERVRREAAGEPPLPAKPGPRRIYKYKPDDYARHWKPDERAARKYPGWENMTKAERREFFGYTYTGPVAPLEMLTPASQAAAAAGEE